MLKNFFAVDSKVLMLCIREIARRSGIAVLVPGPKEGSIPFRFGQDGASMPVSKCDFGSWILFREGWKSSLGAPQIVVALQFEMPTVGIHDQYFVDGVERGGDSSPHGILPPMV